MVVENLSTHGYRLGPREKLDEKHIMLMTKTIASYHGSVYAFKVKRPELFKEMVNSLERFPFYEDRRNSFDALYSITLDRLKNYFHNVKGSTADAVNKLHAKYIDKPSSLLQHFLAENADFDVIIHGDYNRNNVMFKYNSKEGFENPQSVKMFDFQWLKYASPVLDLSFFLYMNTDPDLLDEKFDEILKTYHSTLVTTFKSAVKGHRYDENLPLLSFEKFMDHFKSFAFYGCLIASWFLPVMLADLETCANTAKELTDDLHSDASKEICLSIDEPAIVKRVTKIVKHAHLRGYLSRLIEK